MDQPTPESNQQSLIRCRIGDLVVDEGTREVRRNEDTLAVPGLSFDLLLALIRAAPNALSIDELMTRVWPGRVVNEETVAKRVELLRGALGDDSRNPRYITLVRAHGYRLAVPVDPIETLALQRSRPRIPIAIAAGAIIAVLAGAWLTADQREPASREQSHAGMSFRPALAVLPLDNLSGDGAQDWFASGLHDALIADLSKAGGLKVISRTSTLPYRESGKSMKQIATELDADLVMEGSVMRAGDRVRITVQLIDAHDAHVWSQSYEREVRDVLQLQGDIAEAVAREVNVTLQPQERARLTARRSVRSDSYDLYLQGLHYLDRSTPESDRKGLALLHRSTEIDPTDPLPYARLAVAYSRMGHAPGAATWAFPRSSAAALQALGLDNEIAEAHLAVATNNLYFYWDWEKAEASLRRALELSPSLGEAYAHYAWLHVIHGRVDKALDSMQIAMQLDPQDLQWRVWHSWISVWCGDPEPAVGQLQRVIEVSPAHPVAHFVLGQAYAALGRHEDAIGAFTKAAEVSPRWAWGLAQGRAIAGQREEALAFAEQHAREKHPDPWALAEIYVALGDHEEALSWLEKGYEVRRDWMPWMSTNHFFKPLRHEPRFKEIERRMNLPAAQLLSG